MSTTCSSSPLCVKNPITGEFEFYCDIPGNSSQCQQLQNTIRQWNRQGYYIMGCYPDPSCADPVSPYVPCSPNTHCYPQCPSYPYCPSAPYLPPYTPSSVSGNACSTQEKALCYPNVNPYPSYPSACVPAVVGHGDQSDVCFVGWDDPCHLVDSGEGVCPRSCMSKCCPGNFSPPPPSPPSPSSGCPFKLPCLQPQTNEIRYDCNSDGKGFPNVADAYNVSHSPYFPRSILPTCSSSSHSFLS